MRQILASVSCLIALLVYAGCDRADDGGASGAVRKPRVVATTTMIGDLARRIGGERIELVVMIPAGTDPHTFKPSTGDLGALRGADLVLYNGLHLEGKMVELFEEQLKDRAVPVTRDIPESTLLPWAAGQGGAHDPHVWFDARLWSTAAKTVGEALAKPPAHAAEFRERAVATSAALDTLHAEALQKLASIPKEVRVLVTSHDAYNYFGRAYDVEVRGLQGISTETEAGLSNINGAVDFIIARKIPAVFVESSVNHKTIERVQADCKSRGVHIAIGGELYSDAMGVPGERPGYAVETYEGMFRYNVDTIVNALGGR